MPVITEEKLVFTFPDDWLVEKYDDTEFYRKDFQRLQGTKCVDIVAFAPHAESLWLIEARDYRFYPRSKTIDLFTEVAHKVRDTLASLYVAQKRTGTSIHRFAELAGQKPILRVALHIEQPDIPTEDLPLVVDRSNGRLKLQKTLRVVDPDAWLCEINAMPPDCPWQVAFKD